MSWRTVVITERCKLDLKMGYLVVRGQEIRRIFLDEIAILLIEDPAVAMTGNLLAALTEKKVRVIFCDVRHSPAAELVPCYGSHDSSQKIMEQIGWTAEMKAAAWACIIEDKLRKQAEHLEERGHPQEAELIRSYIPQIEAGDVTNREGHAAKVYFNALFGKAFVRSSENAYNAALNYGYGIVLSAFNRAVSANGYLTQLGLHHKNPFNQFNLSSDIMEPFRILVDRRVFEMAPTEFASEQKHALVRLLEDQVIVEENRQTVLNAIDIYTRSVFRAMAEKDLSLMKTYVRK